MHKDLQSVCDALESIATAVTNAWGAEITICENWGWFGPAVTRHELAQVARSLASDIHTAGIDELDDNLLKFVRDIPHRLTLIQSHTIPHIYSGNAGQAIPAYLTTLALIRAQLLPALGWQVMPDVKALPASLARRARAAQAELDQLIPNISNIETQIKQIQDAHAISDTLPIDLATLAEAKTKHEQILTDSAIKAEKIKAAQESASVELKSIQEFTAEAEQLVKKCESAYQITTTKGLAGAFHQRANTLAISMWVWVFSLAVALFIGSLISGSRLSTLSNELIKTDSNWTKISIYSVLLLLSIGAPIWFAWVATKQIGQRFRLAEDYAFKASVAKAYEGYRKEAIRIDPAFESQLFESALTRLDEAPLRLVETETHGSPWHELANSELVRRAINSAPELRQKVIELLLEAKSVSKKGKLKRETDMNSNVSPHNDEK